MSKIKYLMKRIAHLDYQNMMRIAGQIHQKTGKNTLTILMDIIKCGFTYQAGYYDYLEFEFYLLNKKQRLTYLTRGINNEIVRRYNQKEYWHYFDDKGLFNKTFAPFLKRKWLVFDGNNKPAFMSFMDGLPEIILKPLDGEGGKGIEKIVISEEVNLEKLFLALQEKGKIILEECITQHPTMAKLYPKSVNTLRIFTFCHHDHPFFLQAILKMGNGSIVDNFSSGGMYTFVDEQGKVLIPAIDRQDHIFEKHPATQVPIVGFSIPHFFEAVAMVKEAAKVIPQVGYVGWDVAIGENGPILIEGNSFPGVFQMKPSLNPEKIGILPKYRQVMKLASEEEKENE